MIYDPPLQSGSLIRRYKRFLADVLLLDGREVTIHCPNTGSMLNCAEPDSQIWYSTSDNPKRKYSRTWELIASGNELIGINTGRANQLVAEALDSGLILPLSGYGNYKREVAYGEGLRSRVDFYLWDNSRKYPDCYLEVKSVTLKAPDSSRGLFPDAVSVRGAKHLEELKSAVAQGFRSVLVYCVQHSGIDEVWPAAEIDPNYTAVLRDAVEHGVEVFAYRASLSPLELRLTTRIPVNVSGSE